MASKSIATQSLRQIVGIRAAARVRRPTQPGWQWIFVQGVVKELLVLINLDGRSVHS